jgi:hypothetical protein
MSATTQNFSRAFPPSGEKATHLRVREITADDFVSKVRAEAVVGRFKGNLGTQIQNLPFTGRVSPLVGATRMVMELNPNRMGPFGKYQVNIIHSGLAGYIGTTALIVTVPAYVTAQCVFSSLRMECVTSLVGRDETMSAALTVRGYGQRLSLMSESTLGNVVVGPRVMGTQYPVNVLSGVSSTMAAPRFRESTFWRERWSFPPTTNPAGIFGGMTSYSGVGAVHSRMVGMMSIEAINPTSQIIDFYVDIVYDDGSVGTRNFSLLEPPTVGGQLEYAVNIGLDDNEGTFDHYGVVQVNLRVSNGVSATYSFEGYLEHESGEQSGERKPSLIGVVEGVKATTVISVSGMIMLSITPLQASGQAARFSTGGAAVECDWDEVVADLDDRPRAFAEEVVNS